MAHSSVEDLSARFAANANDRLAFEALEETHFVAGRWPALVDLYAHRLAASELAGPKQAAARARLLLRLAQVLEERCNRVNDAVARYEEAVRTDPSLRPALTQLRRIHARRDAWDLTLQVAEMEAALPMRPFERAAFASEIGELWLRRLNEPRQALASFEQAVTADPQHAPALLGLASAHEALGQAAEAAAALGRAVDVLKGADRARALVRLARLIEGPLANPRRALDLYRRAYTDDARNQDALEALARHAEANQQWDQLEDLHERRFALETDPIRKLAIAHDAGRIQLEQRRNPLGARHWFRRAHELFPDDPVVHLYLADVARLSGNTGELTEHLRRAAALAAEATPLGVLRESAKLASAAGDHAQAVADLQRAVAAQPQRSEVAHELASALWRAGRYTDMVELLETTIEQVPAGSTEQAALWLALANAHELGTHDVEAACEAYEQAARSVPADPRVVSGLDRLLRKNERWDALRAHLARSAAAAEPAAAVELHCQRGALEIEHFEDLDCARDCFETALSLDSDCLRARQGLERIALALGDDDTLLDAFEREAATTADRSRLAFLVGELTRIHAERGQPERALHWFEHLAAALPEDLATLRACARLQDQLGRSGALCRTLETIDRHVEGRDRAAVRRQLGALHAERGDIAEALAAYRGALEAHPKDLDSARACVALLEGSEHAEERAAALRRVADLATGSEQVATLHALGCLLAEGRRDLPGALACFEAIVEAPDAPPDCEQRVLSTLEALERFDALCARLEQRRARLDPLAPEAFTLDLRRAELLEGRLGRPDAAIPLFDLVRSALPDDERARSGLERALRRTGNAARLAQLLAEDAERERDPERRAQLLLERAGLLLEPLRALPEARALLAEIADGSSSVAGLAEGRLLALLEQERDWPELAARLETRLGRGPASQDAELHRRLAFVCRDRLNDAAAAAQHLEAAVALEPGRCDVIQSLARLYQDLDRAEDQVRVLELELPHAERERARQLHHRVAELATTRLGDADLAERHYQALLALDPTSVPALGFLMRRMETEHREAELAELLRMRLRHLPADASAETSLRLRIAGIEAGPLADPETAAATLEPAAAVDESLLVVAEPLADLYQRLGRHEELVTLAERAARMSTLPAERASWRLRIGDVLRKAGDLAGAAAAVRQGLADRPDDAADAVLRDLYRQLGESRPLALQLEAQLARVTGASEMPLRLELAGLLEGPLGRPTEALGHLRRVLEIAPGHAEALARACALAERTNDANALDPLLADAATRASTPRERAALLTRRADLLAGPLGRPEEAAALYTQALGHDPASESALAGVRRSCAQREDWRGVLASLERSVAQLAPEARGRRIELLREAAALAAEHLDADAALPWLERLRVCLPEDAELLAQLAAAHRSAGRHAALREVLEARLPLLHDSAERVALQLERAQLFVSQLSAPESAIAALEQARAAEPDAVAVLEALAALYQSQGRRREQLAVLEDRIGLADGTDRGRLHREAARIARDLGLGLEATQHLNAALLLPSLSKMERVEALRELSALWRSLGRTDLAVTAAEAELAALDPDAAVFAERRRALRFDLARAHDTELGHVDAAIAQLRTLIDVEQETGDRLEQAELWLLDLLERADDCVELERRLSTRLARRNASEDGEAWLELARLHRERFGRPAAAAAAYRETLHRTPDCLEAQRGLRTCAELLGDFETVANTLESELALRQAAPGHERAPLLRRLGGVRWHPLDETAQARSAFAAALEIDPTDLVALRSLEALAEGMEDWRGATELLEREIGVLGERDTARRRSCWLRIAELTRERCGEPMRAQQAFEQADALEALAPVQLAAWAETNERLGQRESFAALYGRWMDAPGAAVSALDRIRLSDTLAQLGRTADALARAEQAVEQDPQLGEGWDRVATLCETLERREPAAEALVRSATCTGGREAAVRRLGAAELVREQDPERAVGWLELAISDDPALAASHARLALVSAQLGRLSVAERAAERALALPESDDDALTPALRLETALVGARAARAQDHREAAAGLFAAVLALEADHPEALFGLGELRLALGDASGARSALLRLLERPAGDADRAVQLTLLADAHERLQESEAALRRYREALALDPDREPAHAGLARLLVREGQNEEAIGALTAWARLAGDAETRSARLLQAAELELSGRGRVEAAERLLRDALGAWSRAPGAWGMLSELLATQGRSEDVISLAPEALAHASSAHERSRVALTVARAMEQHGALREAAEHYRLACTENPRASDAALSAARLLRGLGEWQGAADLLAAFVAAAPPNAGALTAPVHHQLGRLLSGPLESLEAGLAAYRAALAADPELTEAREALADLLVHRPAFWEEAITRHCELLAANPIRLTSLRALLRIARARGHDLGVAAALTLLRALGVATAQEQAEAATRLPIPLDRMPRFSNPVWETARGLAQEAAEEIGQALGVGTTAVPDAQGLTDPVARFRAEVTVAEAALAATALVPLGVEQLGETITLVAQLTAEAEAVSGDGHVVNALSAALSRRARKRLKRVLGETPAQEIAAIDFAAWRAELRGLASVAALASSGAELRTAFLAWVAAEDPEGARQLGAEGELCSRVGAIPEARALLTRLIETWTPFI